MPFNVDDWGRIVPGSDMDKIKDDELDLAELRSALGGYWANGRWYCGGVELETVSRLGSTPDAWTVCEPDSANT